MEDKIDLITGIQSAVEARKPIEQDDNIGQFIGEALSDDQKINHLMASNKPEITILVGFVGFGKTSFVSSFYQTLLQDGELAGYTFYDSDTLVGFERRSFLRRLTEFNVNIAPETKRTLRGEPHLLNFRLYHPKDGEKVVVLSDHSGEDYEKYASKKGEIANDVLLKNADRIMFFVDSEKLCNNERLSLTNRYAQLLTNMKENGIFGREVKLQIVFNKIDKVVDRNKFLNEKHKFSIKFNGIVGKPIDCSYEICANNLRDNANLINLFKDIILNTINKKTGVSQASSLDWVNMLLRKNK